MLWLHPHQTSIMHATVQPCSACARHSASQSRCNIPQCNAHALSSQLESHTRPTSCLESTRVGCHSMRQSSTLLAAVASERPAMQASGGRVQDGDAGVVDSTDAVCESLSLLEWDTLCRQVACFCATTMAADELLEGRLPLGTSPQHSRVLQQETRQAMAADLQFTGAVDIRPAAQLTRDGYVLTAVQLAAVASTLEAALELNTTIQATTSSIGGGAAPNTNNSSTDDHNNSTNDSSTDKNDNSTNTSNVDTVSTTTTTYMYPALAAAALSSQAVVQLQALVDVIRHCIQEAGGGVLDRAAPTLQQVRQQLRTISQQRTSLAEEWARTLHTTGASERPQVMVRRDRLCVPVKVGRRGELPSGSVTLGSSNSGNTLYVEPAPLVGLNNQATMLADRQREEEEVVLRELSLQVAGVGDALLQACGMVVRLDVASARAGHAAWVGAVAPVIVEDAATVHIQGAVHPILAQPHRPPLPTPPSLEGLTFDDGYLGAVGGEASRGPTGTWQLDMSMSSSSDDEQEHPPTRPLVPINLTVPPTTSVVAVTGPNTGGKTASLKALGLLCLMAKAGMYIPVAGVDVPGAGVDVPGAGVDVPVAGVDVPVAGMYIPVAGVDVPGANGGGEGSVCVAWFDKVLADIGDGQSMQQNLSTFSAHITRIQRILSTTTTRSLVLLDEVGSGTDPVEGAVLAAAILKHLATRAALTYATTHHGLIKDVAANTPGFVNASVEFDVGTLRPTYRLLWGVAGQSNALLVADGLGFDGRVVEDARGLLQQGLLARSTQSQANQLLGAVTEQLQAARDAAEQAADQRRALVETCRRLEQEIQAARGGLGGSQEGPVGSRERGLGSKEGPVGSRERGLGKEEGGGQRMALETLQGELEVLVARAREGSMDIQDVYASLDTLQEQLLCINSTASSHAHTGTPTNTTSGGNANATGEGVWRPHKGARVVLPRMGGVLAQVVTPAADERPTARVSVRLQSNKMVLEVRQSDILPATDADISKASRAKAKQKNVVKEIRAAAAAQRAGGASASYAAVLGVVFLGANLLVVSGDVVHNYTHKFPAQGDTSGAVTIQTTSNTVDVRGMRSIEAMVEVDAALTGARGGSVVFVVHGVGTGELRRALRAHLSGHRGVVRWEEEPQSQGGCTMVYVR